MSRGDDVAQTPIPTYFSHSYRPEDREINEAIWRLFWDKGFAFTVDPKSSSLSTAQLELMMRRSACFVAVAARRSEQTHYKTSPFIVYEYGLAVQAQKPRLVLVEVGVAGHYFDEASAIAFDRDAILQNDLDPNLLGQIDRLTEQSRAYVRIGQRALGSVGLILSDDEPYAATRDAVSGVLESAGYLVEDVPWTFQNPFEFALDVDRHDFVVLPVDDLTVPGWVLPALQGRFIPTVKLMRHRLDHERIAASLPPLVGGHALELVTAADELVVWWDTVEELVSGLERHLDELQRPRRQFRTVSDGVRYLRSLGRSSHGPVFVSNAGTDNEIARSLTLEFDLNNIRLFHYLYNPAAIELGASWRMRLPDVVRASRLFVALISPAYWASDICMNEWRLASEMHERGELEIYPYFLKESSVGDTPGVAAQGRSLAGMTIEDQIATIREDVDRFLVGTIPASASTSAPVVEASLGPVWTDEPQPQVDIALVTVLPEEYAAVLKRVEHPKAAKGTSRLPNLHSWQLGEVQSSLHKGPYRVVLGLAGQPGTSGGLLLVLNTIDAFRPMYVILVGIAGALRDAGLGDAVVSDRIFGYEYGKYADEFTPRPDWNHPATMALVTAASTMESLHPDWHADLPTKPRIHVGPVASGNKVVDNLGNPAFRRVLELWPKLLAVEMEGVGASEAIRAAGDRFNAVGFGMVRGISDIPRREVSSDGVKGGDVPQDAAEAPGDAGGNASAQARERDEWKVAASEVAAELAIQMIRRAWPRGPRELDAG
jgi:nucleoside phosphorylase